MPPVGLMYGRYCLPDEPVAYLADSPETALYETLLRRDTVSRSLSELRRRCLVEFVTTGPLRLADLRGLAEPYPVRKRPVTPPLNAHLHNVHLG